MEKAVCLPSGKDVDGTETILVCAVGNEDLAWGWGVLGGLAVLMVNCSLGKDL